MSRTWSSPDHARSKHIEDRSSSHALKVVIPSSAPNSRLDWICFLPRKFVLLVVGIGCLPCTWANDERPLADEVSRLKAADVSIKQLLFKHRMLQANVLLQVSPLSPDLQERQTIPWRHFGSLLRLKEQDRTVSQVEVDEVLRLYCDVSLGHRLRRGCSKGLSSLPCVTKLPKFLPTMQCHVAPLRSSN